MASAASLLAYLNTKADINYYTQQLTYWSNLYEGNQTKLSEQVKLEGKWMDAYDDALNGNKECKFGNVTYAKEGDGCGAASASIYASLKVAKYDREVSESLADLDIEYDTMKTMYDAYLQALKAQEEGEKNLVNANVTDTHLLGQ